MSLSKEFSKILKILETSFQNSHSRFGTEPVKKILEKHCKSEFKERIYAEFLGSGPLESLTKDPLITEIILDGPSHIFYEKKGILHSYFDQFLSPWTFENFVRKLCLPSKIDPSLQTPFGDGRWQGFRVHIISPPLTSSSYHITLRKHPEEIWTLTKLKETGWADEASVDILRDIIQQKMNILIAGPTSSGKTSVLNAFLQELDPQERTVIIEDTDELAKPNKFSVKLLTRNTPSLPVIDQSLLVQQSLRMRPDRIIMGEVRGAEAKDLIMALATGHEGSMGTLHAHHHKQALLRLELLVQSSGLNWSTESIRSLIHLGLQIIVLVKKEKQGRKLQGIYQMTGLEKTGFLFEPLFKRKPQLSQSSLIHHRRSLGHQTNSLQSLGKGNNIPNILRPG